MPNSSTNMKFRSILSFSPEMRTNVIFCLLFVILFSLQSLIPCVQILPNKKIIAILDSQTLFVTCKKSGSQPEGYLKWYSQSGVVEETIGSSVLCTRIEGLGQIVPGECSQTEVGNL